MEEFGNEGTEKPHWMEVFGRKPLGPEIDEQRRVMSFEENGVHSGKVSRIEKLRQDLIPEVKVENKEPRGEINLDSISIRNLPIGWEALGRLGREINGLKNDPFDKQDWTEVKPPVETYHFLPMVASVVAHRHNPEVTEELPTMEDIKLMKPWLKTVGKAIGKISENWRGKFDRYIGRKGQESVVSMGTKIGEFADWAGQIDNPREQLLSEVDSLYNQLATPEYKKVLTSWVEEDQLVGIEEKIRKMLLFGVKEDKLPMLSKLLPVVKSLIDTSQASIAGAELMEGIYFFLKRQGAKNLRPVPRAVEFDLFDWGTWERGFAEMFAGERLEKVKVKLPDILTLALKALPVSGPALADKVYGLADDICVAKVQGRSNQEIATAVFGGGGKIKSGIVMVGCN